MVVLSLMNDSRHLRKKDRQAVVDGSGEGAVSGNGKEGDFAEGEVGSIKLCLARENQAKTSRGSNL